MIGDLVADLNAVALASNSFRETGSIGPWLAQQLADFRKLPPSLDTICGQADAVSRVLSERGSANTPAGQAVREAYRLAEQAKAQYPGVSVKVDTVTAAIAPVMPKIYAGTWDSDVIAALLRSGGDVALTIHKMTDLIGKRDEAQRLLQEAVTNPTLPSETREAAWSALTSGGTGMTMLRVALLLGGGYVLVKALRGMFR